MSQEFCGCQTDIVQESFVKKICPKEFAEFITLIREHCSNFNQFAKEMNFVSSDIDDVDLSELLTDSTVELETNIREAWKNLKRAFKQNTGGLVLGLVYHEAQERGEGLDGYAWEVDGVRVLSKAGKKYADEIERISWVEIG